MKQCMVSVGIIHIVHCTCDFAFQSRILAQMKESKAKVLF